jgi:iron complex outermembrane recepter protein
MNNSHSRQFGRTALALSASIGALLVGAPAFAQAAVEEDPATAEIVVTAQFREQNLQDVPLSITAVNAALLEARSQTSIADVARQAPSVVLVPGGAVFGPALGAQIRGVGQFDFNPALEPGVGIYVDDVYFPTLTGSVFDLLDLDRVEILRGPQGTLTGRNSIGGAIKLFSKKPNGEEGGYFEASYGSRNRIGLRGSADIKLGENVFARFAGVHKEQKGYVDQLDYGCVRPGNPEGIAATVAGADCRVDRLGGEGYSALRGQLRYKGEAIDVVIAADYTNIDHTNPGEVVTVARNANFLCGRSCTYASYRLAAGTFLSGLGPPPQPAAADTFQSNRQKFDGWGASANIDFDISDSLQLQSITAYRKYTSTFGTDDDFTPTLNGSGGNNRLSHRFFSQEVRLNGEIGDIVNWTVGGYYSDQQTTYFTQQDIRYIIPNFALQFFGDDPVDAKSKAAFATVIVKPTEAFTITGGLRYTDENKQYRYLRRNYNGTVNTFLDPANTLNNFVARYSGNKLDYRLSFDYRISPEVLVFASTSTGFKGGGTTPRPFNVDQANQGSFAPETLTAYEIGVKTDFLDRAVRLNVSAFLNEYKDIQLPLRSCTFILRQPGNVPDGGPCGVIANAGDARYKGFEAELAITPTAGLNFDGSISYIDTKWKRLDARLGTSININDRASSAPQWKWSAGIQYKADLGDNGSLTPRFDISHSGSRFGGRAFDGSFFLPSYTLANARLTWRNSGEDFDISLEATNLFKEYYFTARFDAVGAFTGNAYSQIGKPREWAITVKKKF